MKKAYVLLNHQLTENQIEELKKDYNCSDIIYPDQNLVANWSGIAATKELDLKVLAAVISWLGQANKEDVLVVQGEFGSTFYVVDYALKNGLVPVHAVTQRIAEESREGEVVTKKYVFQHCCFREYRYYSSEDKN